MSMGRSAAVELDFFSMEKRSSDGCHSATNPPIFERRRSFRDIQGVISKMNPQVVKSVIANQTQLSKSPLPVCDPTLRLSNGYDEEEKNKKTAPMTIFYNGMVVVFEVSPHKAQDILKVADECHPKLTQQKNVLESFDEGDLPITRKNSLQRFLQKRKERLTEVSPYLFQA